MNEHLWKRCFENELPEWPCPHCEGGRLRADGRPVRKYDPDALQYIDPEDLNGPFHAWMQCTSKRCGAHISVHGNFDIAEDVDYDDEGVLQQAHITLLYPLSIHPAPEIIKVPENTPEPVSDNLRRSFGLFWADGSACANAIRAAIECIADSLGQPRETEAGKFIPLASRIRGLNDRYPSLAEALRVIKDIGNSGAHGGEVNRKALLYSFELLEIDLGDLYGDREGRRRALIEELRKPKP